MHPDDVIAGLRRELDRLAESAEDYAERKKEINAEIKRVDGLDRPAVEPEKPDTVVNHDVAYLAGLKRELERIGEDGKERVAEIKDEIKRVEAIVHKAEREASKEVDEEVKVADEKPSKEEIEQRKQARAGQKVERAVNQPGGRKASDSAPEGAEKE